MAIDAAGGKAAPRGTLGGVLSVSRTSTKPRVPIRLAGSGRKQTDSNMPKNTETSQFPRNRRHLYGQFARNVHIVSDFLAAKQAFLQTAEKLPTKINHFVRFRIAELRASELRLQPARST